MKRKKHLFLIGLSRVGNCILVEKWFLYLDIYILFTFRYLYLYLRLLPAGWKLSPGEKEELWQTLVKDSSSYLTRVTSHTSGYTWLIFSFAIYDHQAKIVGGCFCCQDVQVNDKFPREKLWWVLVCWKTMLSIKRRRRRRRIMIKMRMARMRMRMALLMILAAWWLCTSPAPNSSNQSELKLSLDKRWPI